MPSWIIDVELGYKGRTGCAACLRYYPFLRGAYCSTPTAAAAAAFTVHVNAASVVKTGSKVPHP